MVTAQKQEEWDGLIAESSESVVPPSYMQAGEIITNPTDIETAPLRISELRFKGYVEVWDSVTGVQSLQPWWLMWQTMRKTRPDGSLVFTRVNPQIAPDYGEDLFCPLNPQAPEHGQLKRMGFRPCTKQHIPNQDAVNRHLRGHNQRASTALELAKVDRIRDEDRAMQREMLDALTKAAVQGVTASQAEAVGINAETTETPAEASIPQVGSADAVVITKPKHTVKCKNCQREFSAVTLKAAKGYLHRHNLICKG